MQHKAKETLNNPDKWGHTPLIVALLNRQTPTAEFLVKKGAEFNNILIEQTEVWQWAVKNGEWTCAAFLLRHLNEKSTERKAVIVRVFRSSSPQPEGEGGSVSQDATPESVITAYVFAENSTQTAITVETVRDAAAGYYDVATELCEQRDGSLIRRQREFNGDGAFKIIGLLLDHLGKETKITEGVVQAAAGNKGSEEEVIKLLLDGRAKVEITEELFWVIASKFNRDIIKLLLDR